MRAVFRYYSPQLKSGSYVFVAKAAILDASYEQLLKDFKRVLKNAKAFT